MSLVFPPSPPSLCAMCVLYVAVLPLLPRRERGGIQAGRWERPRRDRVVPRCHDGVDGSECTARWVVQGAAGTLSGVRTAQCMHMLRGTCPIQYHTTVPRPASIYYSPLYPGSLVCGGQHFSPSGLAGNGNDKDKAREAGPRRPVLYLGTQVLYCGTVCPGPPPRKCLSVCLLSLCSCSQSVYTAGRAPCIRTWKVLRNNT